MSSFDTLAIVSYVRNLTEQNVTFIGHSEGSEIGLAYLVRNPKQTDVAIFVALAPIVLLIKFQNPLLRMFSMLPLWFLEKTLGKRNVLEGPTLFGLSIPAFCETFPSVCSSLICYWGGCGVIQILNSINLEWVLF